MIPPGRSGRRRRCWNGWAGRPAWPHTYLPIVVFALANGLFGLWGAIWCAVGVAVALCALRLIRREPVMPAISGLIGVAVASFVAYRTAYDRATLTLFAVFAARFVAPGDPGRSPCPHRRRRPLRDNPLRGR
ncbi:hypothetical protein Val02_30800 [Virgisporangium aliadipatigenens]|uniref:Uncharacterized protein n=1 Tax=Virgisporangium aliadipatigenens TaxID=741659 RepID=A0A8J4DQ41_9ACTN|nr:DUF3159 domain-containing protein [Virgisporangium aliadipatigenens]GIJ46194.1 hypothetical protein Val02_30800 [Virgisporangium aliadipatigenens]